MVRIDLDHLPACSGRGGQIPVLQSRGGFGREPGDSVDQVSIAHPADVPGGKLSGMMRVLLDV
ncbi:MAG: hypothetical protein WDN69_00745 [Aliidongia sp.]